jgi:hypothetical protein
VIIQLQEKGEEEPLLHHHYYQKHHLILLRIFIWSSFLKGTVRDLLTKNASERLMHNNQHRINGAAISNVAKRKEVKRLKAGSETVYRVQPTAEVGAALIRETLTNFVQSENQRKATKRVVTKQISISEPYALVMEDKSR